MSRKAYDLSVVTGRYTQNGEDKTIWERVGSVFKQDDGKYFILLKPRLTPPEFSARKALTQSELNYSSLRIKEIYNASRRKIE